MGNVAAHLFPMKKSEPIDLATLYLGQSRHALDGSNRIMMPSDWRVEGAPSKFHVMVSNDHLVIFPPGTFQTFRAELHGNTADKRLIPEIDRQLNELVRLVSLDRFSRLPLPREFTIKVGIEKHGEMVGRFSKFEIWAPKKRNQPSADRD